MADRVYVVMGLLDSHSIAWAIGAALRRAGACVVFTVQNEVVRRRYLDKDAAIPPDVRAGLDCRYCDVTDAAQVQAVFAGIGPLAGVAHSLAYANPKTLLGPELHTDAVEDIQKSYLVSAVSLATVARCAVPHMGGDGALVALSFDADRAYPFYNWMGVHKAALEALVRALARRHGRDGVRVNAVSAGPLKTMASARIPGFDRLLAQWAVCSPLPWDPVADKAAVGDAVAFLLGPGARRITGQILHVDGGVSAVGGSLVDEERGGRVAPE